MGFNVPNYERVVNSIQGVIEYIKYWEINRNNLPFEIDGVVIKINKIDYQNQLGFTSKFPRWAISYKYKAENLATRLKSISFNVGRTGAVTPVAPVSELPAWTFTVFFVLRIFFVCFFDFVYFFNILCVFVCT